jgi:hypothetical protein
MGILSGLQFRRDLRKSPRHELHFPAYIAIGDQSLRQSCIIHDLSEDGARLTVGARVELPDRFTLVFSRNCRVVRRTEDGQIGVEFLPAKS